MHSLNFSIYEDKTQNTLWRIQNGALDNVKPKVRKRMKCNGEKNRNNDDDN